MKRLRALNEAGRGMQLGLERMEGLVAAAGLERGLGRGSGAAVVHVAGTNGKGSVAHKVCEGLRRAGQSAWRSAGRPGQESSAASVGLFTSPHVSSYRERIRVDGRMLDEAAAEALTARVAALQQATGLAPTYFETLALMALLHFDAADVDFAVLEAGLGGAGDATNVVRAPRACVITSLAMDHVAVLGPRLEDIARAKGGIFKPGAHVILGAGVAPHEALLRDMAEAAGAASVRCVALPRGRPCSVDEENTLTALATLRALGVDTSALLLEGERPPGRLEVFRIPAAVAETDAASEPAVAAGVVILDGAHNEAAFDRLGEDLAGVLPASARVAHFVLAMSVDRDVGPCVRALVARLAPLRTGLRIRLTVAPADNAERAASAAAQLAQAQAALAQKSGEGAGVVEGALDVGIDAAETCLDAFHRAQAEAAANGDPVVVCGSFNALGAIRAELTQTSLDPVNLNENRL